MTTFKKILKESMSIEQEKECFPIGFDPTKRDDAGCGLDETWDFPGNIDDYSSMLYDQIKHHWAPHQMFDDLNKGNEKIAKAVSNAYWAGYMAGIRLERERKDENI